MTTGNVVVISFLAVTLLLIIVNVLPKETARTYISSPVQTEAISYQNVTATTYESIKWAGGASHDRGTHIKGEFTNNTPNVLFVYDAKASILSPDFTDADPLPLTTYCPRFDYRFENAEYAKNWHQVRGYLIAPSQTVKFEMGGHKLLTDQAEEFKFAISWRYIDIDQNKRRTNEAAFNFEFSDKSLFWSEFQFRDRSELTAAYLPDLRIPEAPR